MSKAEEYIKKRTRGKVNHITENFPWIATTEALEAVEIAREEMIEWLRKNHEEYQYKAPYNYFDIEQCINDLKQAMKDEYDRH